MSVAAQNAARADGPIGCVYQDLPKPFTYRPAAAVTERVCAHWPLEGVVRVYAAAVTLGAIADQWLPSEMSSRQALEPLNDVRRVRARVADLAQEFRRVGDWLARGNGPAMASDSSLGNPRGLASSLAESQRLLAKDRHAADMNVLVAWLLQQVLHRLDHMPLQTGPGEPELPDKATYGDMLRGASEALHNAAHIADASERFVEDLDERWHQLRDKVTSAVAVSRSSRATC